MLGGGLDRRPFKYTEEVTIGAAQGQVNLTHNLGTEDFTFRIIEVATDNAIFAPVWPVNANTAAIDVNGPDRVVRIIITG